MRIAITDNFKPNFENYIRWLTRGAADIEVIKLSYVQDNVGELDRCDGLVLTGGGDVDPRFYHREGALNQVRGVDSKRDEFEFRLIDCARDREVPLLGICLQVANVKFGGTLIPDLVSGGYGNHRQSGDEELRHTLQVESETVLWKIVGQSVSEVNSAHHQAAETVGKGLKVSARSSDGVIEALEWADPSNNPFLLLVQWHPERMNDFDNPTSGNVRRAFLSEIQRSRKFEVKVQ
jgi:putative glutamine amidotransferase